MAVPAPLISEDRGPVRILRLNRPEKLNAFNTSLADALCDALEAADEGHVKALVLTSTGRAFSAGADINELRGLDPSILAAAVRRRAELSLRLQQAVPRMRKPVVAALRGAAVGGGGALALSCDMIVAAPDVRLGFPEIRQGLVPALAMPILQRHFPRKLSFELISTGRLLDAQELHTAGVVNQVVAADQVEECAIAIAQGWAALDPVALMACKSLLSKVADVGFQAGLDAGLAVNEAIRTARESGGG